MKNFWYILLAMFVAACVTTVSAEESRYVELTPSDHLINVVVGKVITHDYRAKLCRVDTGKPIRDTQFCLARHEMAQQHKEQPVKRGDKVVGAVLVRINFISPGGQYDDMQVVQETGVVRLTYNDQAGSFRVLLPADPNVTCEAVVGPGTRQLEGEERAINVHLVEVRCLSTS